MRNKSENKFLNFALLITFMGMNVGILSADDVGRGGYAGTHLRMGLGARSMGMGGGSVAMTDDGHISYYNPAGLTELPGRWFAATLNTMALDRRMIYLGYAQPLGGQAGGPLRGGFAVGWLAAGVDNIDARDFSGNDIGSLSSWNHTFYFSFALKPGSRFSLGVSGKMLYSRFPNITESDGALTAVGFGFDLGASFRPTQNVTLGITVHDLRSKYTWDSQDLYERGTQTVDPFLRVVRGGAAVRFLSGRLLATFDLEKVEYYPLDYVTGVEFQAAKGVFARAGLRGGKAAFGGGYHRPLMGKEVHLDYAYVPDPIAPRGNHVFTWSFIF